MSYEDDDSNSGSLSNGLALYNPTQNFVSSFRQNQYANLAALVAPPIMPIITRESCFIEKLCGVEKAYQLADSRGKGILFKSWMERETDELTVAVIEDEKSYHWTNVALRNSALQRRQLDDTLYAIKVNTQIDDIRADSEKRRDLNRLVIKKAALDYLADEERVKHETEMLRMEREMKKIKLDEARKMSELRLQNARKE